MKKKTLLRIITAVALLLYLVIAVAWSVSSVNGSKCRGVRIRISDPDSVGFVTEKGIISELKGFYENAPGELVANLDIAKVTNRLNNNDRIESASVVLSPCALSGGDDSDALGCEVLVDVVPMQPIARVFDGGKSYYINRAGKHISAGHNYHIDVPVIQGNFNDKYQPTELLPLVDYLSENARWGNLVTMIKVDKPSSIILVPAIQGHVINIGDQSNLDDKFDRVGLFYEKVFPVKGWNYYDSISVKWKGQVVATRRNKVVAVQHEEIDEESEKELPAENSSDVMLATDSTSVIASVPSVKKAIEKKAAEKKAVAKKPETKKTEPKKDDVKKPEAKKPEAKKQETKKPEAKKQESKKSDTKKAETKKTDKAKKDAPKPKSTTDKKQKDSTTKDKSNKKK